MTSGYNVAESIYLQPEFNDLCGFRESEIADALNQIAIECEFPEQQVNDALQLMRTFYNGYCFNLSIYEFIYNPTLALYFLKHFQQMCQFPSQMLDDNLAMDRGKITYISQLPQGEQLIVQALNGSEPLTISQLSNRFGVEDMLHASKDTRFLISLLYYFGILTLYGKNEFGKWCFKIPNLVVRKLYVERILEMFLPQKQEREEIRLLAEKFYQTGDLQPISDFMEQRYFKPFDNRDYQSANELTIKTAFLTVLFDDVFYMMDSETSLERRYADLTMIIRPEQRKVKIHDFLFEFKYLKLSDVGMSGEKVRTLSIEELKALAPVKDKLAESEKQLLDYQTRLKSKQDHPLRLKLISVVAVGFERVVWKNV
jgi:hypothetical protein